MHRRLTGLVMASAMFVLGLGPVGTASAASTLSVDIGGYMCSHGTCNLGSANVGAYFAGVVTSVGGQGPTPYTWSVAAGSLPADMLLTPSYGVYSAYVYGVPTGTGTATFTLQVRDGAGDTARQSFSLTIGPGTPTPADSVSITSASWSARQHRLTVVATDPLRYLTLTATLTSTGQPLCIGQNCTGTLLGGGNGQYTGSFFSEANPGRITVRSNLGAAATAVVTATR